MRKVKHETYKEMRGPTTPSLDNYLKQMAAAPPGARIPPNGLIQQEQAKLKQLMQKRGELEHQMRLLEIQISKVQGGLEVLQQLYTA